jgi:hypothetical protein
LDDFISVDCEWYPFTGRQSPKHGVDMVQIAVLVKPDAKGRTCKMEVHCFHVARMKAPLSMPKKGTKGANFPVALKALLEDRTVSKVGKSIASADAVRLREGHGIVMPAMLDLNKYATALGVTNSNKMSLASLYNAVTGNTLAKPANVRTCDWRKKFDLTSDEVRYAASDAVSGLVVHNQLLRISILAQTSKDMAITDEITDMDMDTYIQQLKSLIKPKPKTFIPISLSSDEESGSDDSVIDLRYLELQEKRLNSSNKFM